MPALFARVYAARKPTASTIWWRNVSLFRCPNPIVSIGRTTVGERAFAILEHLQDEFRLIVEVVGVENFFDGVARPNRIDKPGVLLRDILRERREPCDGEPVGLACVAVEPFVRGLHVKRRAWPRFVEVVGSEAPAGEPAEEFHAVART